MSSSGDLNCVFLHTRGSSGCREERISEHIASSFRRSRRKSSASMRAANVSPRPRLHHEHEYSDLPDKEVFRDAKSNVNLFQEAEQMFVTLMPGERKVCVTRN